MNKTELTAKLSRAHRSLCVTHLHLGPGRAARHGPGGAAARGTA
ncbi:MAG: hypothetical protein JWN77_2627 [Frankiales bacterium]|jgi:hypothetical protein|nr:hypothetical protein [Frankiales bacterium]